MKDILVRTLLTVVKLARKPDQPALNDALDYLQQTLACDPDEAALADAVDRLKSEVIKFDLGFKGDSPAPICEAGPGSSDVGKDKGVLAAIRTGYLDILAGLEIDLDSDYLSLLAALRKKVTQASDLNELLGVRPDVEEAVRRFAQQVFDERKKAAGFIAEVAQQLEEMEVHLLSSTDQLQKKYKEDSEFSNKLEAELGRTAVSVKDAQQLESLKNLVLNKLSSIGAVIKKKKFRDRERMKDVGRHLGGVRRKFGDIQGEINRVQEENKKLIQKLQFDCLTGAYNRMAFEEMTEAELSRFQRYGRTFTLGIFDIDNFKSINDNFGHLVGDKCLQECVKKISSTLRRVDLLARFGGDEFVLLLPETDLETSQEVAEKIRKKIEETDFLVRGQKAPLTISVGLTEVQKEDSSISNLIERADRALYQAKNDGRNRVESS